MGNGHRRMEIEFFTGIDGSPLKVINAAKSAVGLPAHYEDVVIRAAVEQYPDSRYVMHEDPLDTWSWENGGWRTFFGAKQAVREGPNKVTMLSVTDSMLHHIPYDMDTMGIDYSCISTVVLEQSFRSDLRLREMVNPSVSSPLGLQKLQCRLSIRADSEVDWAHIVPLLRNSRQLKFLDFVIADDFAPNSWAIMLENSPLLQRVHWHCGSSRTSVDEVITIRQVSPKIEDVGLSLDQVSRALRSFEDAAKFKEMVTEVALFPSLVSLSIYNKPYEPCFRSTPYKPTRCAAQVFHKKFADSCPTGNLKTIAFYPWRSAFLEDMEADKLRLLEPVVWEAENVGTELIELWESTCALREKKARERVLL
ncbi:hypothetical protein BDV96DRAFT_652159 [Lophiotrema nucula]|uniref:Uncharacterized protein n=1 Tax=Lophiotrema nucula TaxID=690887 RepID=A0A6A5YRF8_9PLEO|nr:hypothetical protein BDV96DRAFT_652159 [Lophiotrema nucula]